MRCPRDDLDVDFIPVGLDGGYFLGGEVAVAGFAVLEMLREVDPELQADVWRPVHGLAGHLCVHDASPGGHELQISLIDRALVPRKVLVVDRSVEEIGDGFLAAVPEENDGQSVQLPTWWDR